MGSAPLVSLVKTVASTLTSAPPTLARMTASVSMASTDLPASVTQRIPETFAKSKWTKQLSTTDHQQLPTITTIMATVATSSSIAVEIGVCNGYSSRKDNHHG